MSRKQTISFSVNDVSALAQSLVKQINGSSDELGQSRMLNYLAKGAGFGNWHQYTSWYQNQTSAKIAVSNTDNKPSPLSCGVPQLSDDRATRTANAACESGYVSYKFSQCLKGLNLTGVQIAHMLGFALQSVLKVLERER
eukprot:TRINITY_DN5034_c0_g1_i1.p1 TRINITY_DN5034_c0_g1~~TRINITY_DN5034_c0_g1_i1.p1  ORF type:complete len:140 (+),score=9.53 TRINITY_DN5034_c0_g1_i1:263-682(+)